MNGNDAGPDPVRTWQDLYLDAATAPPSVAACVSAAFRLADQIWRQVATDPTLDTETRTAVTGEANWARTALDAYAYLSGSHAYSHLDLPAPQRCTADPTVLRAWLSGHCDLPGFTHITIAESWQIDDEFGWDVEGVGVRMDTLVEQAQRDHVFGVPGYTIALQQITTDDPDDDPIIEHQITLRTPSGATLASATIPPDHLADDDLSGIDAAIAVLTNTANIVNELLTTERRLATHTSGRWHPARPNRGFTALDLSSAAIAPPGPDAPPSPSPQRRHPSR